MKPMKIMKERAEINQIKNKNYRKNNKTKVIQFDYIQTSSKND